MIEKVKLWLKATGITNVVWGAGLVVALIGGWTFIAGVCGGIFVYVNFNVIKKLIQGIKWTGKHGLLSNQRFQGIYFKPYYS